MHSLLLNRSFLIGLIVALCLLILAFDLSIPLGVASGVAYLFPVLVTSQLPGTKPTLLTAALCTGLTLIGLLYSPEGGQLWQVMVNRGLALFVIWTAVFFTLNRKKANKALRVSADHFRSLIENAPLCIHELDLAGQITSMNLAGLAMLGATKESAVSDVSYMDIVSVEDSDRIKNLLDQALAGQPSTFQFRSQAAEGVEPKYFDSSFIPIFNDTGNMTNIMGVTQDVTERHHTLRALWESEDRFSKMADFLPQTIYELDSGGYLTYANSVGLEIFGLEKEDLANGIQVVSLFIPEDAERIQANINAIAKGERGKGR